MASHRRESPLTSLGGAVWRLDDGRYRPVRVLLNRETGRFFFVRHPHGARAEGAERGYTHPELQDLVRAGRTTLDRTTVKALIEAGRDFDVQFMTSWPTEDDVSEIIHEWRETRDPPRVEVPESSPSPDEPMADTSTDTRTNRDSRVKALGRLVVLVPILVALLWTPVSDWFNARHTESWLGGFGLARTIAACEMTPTFADQDESLAVLQRLNAEGFRASRLQGGLTEQAWFRIHLDMASAFRSEDWGQPENVDLSVYGTDFTDEVVEVRNRWFEMIGDPTVNVDAIERWTHACTNLTSRAP